MTSTPRTFDTSGSISREVYQSAIGSMFEAPEAEAARLAQSPVGSLNHALSRMPVNIHTVIQDLMIELPHFEGDPQYTIVVIPLDGHHHSNGKPEARPWRRYNRTWSCVVVASDHPNYPVGGPRISVPEAQLVRGTLRTLDI